MIQLFRPLYRTKEILAEIEQTLESGWTGDGPKCQLFQVKLAEFLKARPGSVRYVSSATAALHLAVHAIDIPKGSPIGTTPITFVSTNAAILYEGHSPHFIDVDPQYLSLDPKLVRDAAARHKIQAVIWVHYAGSVHPDFLRLAEDLYRMNIPVIEDCAHAMGSFYPGTQIRVGSLPHTISCFSFQAVKNLPTADSGAIIVPNEEQYERVNRLSWLGIDKSTYNRTGSTDLYKWKYTVNELGWKYNSNDIMASIALTQLKYIDEDNAYRAEIYRSYQQCLSGGKNLRVISHTSGSSTHLVEIIVPDREKVIAALKLNGYAPGVHYLPNYEFPVFAPYYKNGQCPVTESLADHILTLPTHLQITRADVESISNVVLAASL